MLFKGIFIVLAQEKKYFYFSKLLLLYKFIPYADCPAKVKKQMKKIFKKFVPIVSNRFYFHTQSSSCQISIHKRKRSKERGHKGKVSKQRPSIRRLVVGFRRKKRSSRKAANSGFWWGGSTPSLMPPEFCGQEGA